MNKSIETKQSIALSLIHARARNNLQKSCSLHFSYWLPEDNFYRKLKAIVNLQWLYQATKNYYGTEGQKSIDPVVFFKPMLIGYLENLGSDRRIFSSVSMPWICHTSWI